MRHFLIGTFILASLIITLSSIIYVFVNMPGPLSKDTIIVLGKGESLKDFNKKLHQQNIIKNPKIMLFSMKLANRFNRLKAGEYILYHGVSIRNILHILIEGKSIIHKLTLVEGTTVRQILDKIKNESVLVGEIDENIEEGSLLPSTYFFIYGDTRTSLIERMKANMERTLEALWQARKENIPLKTKEEALVLASIIEKETSLESERKKVASVFINRLNKNMKLQADPTTIYGITLGAYELNRELTKKDLASQTPYNTYYISGLPPKPITNPGKDSIEAVLNPDETNYLFFVVDGNGGHKFSSNLNEHNQNVKSFRNRN